MKICGWSAALIVAAFSSIVWWSNSGVAGHLPLAEERRTANVDDLSSAAGVRYRLAQPRHWRHLVLSR